MGLVASNSGRRIKSGPEKAEDRVAVTELKLRQGEVPEEFPESDDFADLPDHAAGGDILS